MKTPLILDGSNTIKPDKTVVYAKNKVLDYLKAGIINEDGFYEDVLNNDSVLYCGVVETPTRLILFKIIDTVSEISTLHIENNVAVETVILRSNIRSGLNFKVINPIKGEFTFNGSNELIISFSEGIGETANSLRYINIDNLGFDLDVNKYAINADDYSTLNSNKSLKLPILTYLDTPETGLLPIGEYTIYVGYSDTYENDTNYIASMNPVTIYDSSIAQDYFKIYDNDDLTTVTNKSITIEASNLDSSYKVLLIGIVHQINGNKSAYKQYLKYSGTSAIIIVDNVINIDVVDINEIITDNIIIHKANALTKFDSELLIGNTTLQERYDYSDVACNIIVDYELIDIKTNIDYGFGETISVEDTYKSNINIVNNKIFQYDEVYALYIQPIFKTGETGEAFHIPGLSTAGTTTIEKGFDYSHVVNNTARLFVGTSWDSLIPILPIDETDADNIDVRIYTQYADLEALNPGNVRLFQIECITPNGRMAIWENEDEVYEEVHPYAGEKVRHHKIPDYATIHGAATSVNNEYQTSVPKLVLSNIDFSAYPEIQGYKILMAARDEINRTVVDETALYNTFEPSDIKFVPFGRLDSFVGGNPTHVSEVIRRTPIIATSEIYRIYRYEISPGTWSYKRDSAMIGAENSDLTKLMGYAPKTMKNNDPVNINYLKVTNLIQYDTDRLENSPSNVLAYTQVEDVNNKYTIDADLTKPFTDILYDGSECTEVKQLLLSKGFSVNSVTPIVGDGLAEDNIYMHYAEPVLYFKTNKEIKITSNAVKDKLDTGPFFVILSGAINKVLYAKTQMKKYTSNIYLNLTSQRLVKIHDNTVAVTSTSVGGDSFLSGVALRSSSRRINSVTILPYISEMNFELRTPTNKEESIETIHTPVEDNYWSYKSVLIENLFGWRGGLETTVTYLNFRHKWLGRHPLTFEYWGAGVRSIKSDWSLIGDNKGYAIFSIYNLFTDKFPRRVYRSLPMQTESVTTNWRTFAPTSYHDVENAKGQIQDLNAVGNAVYIAQEYALVLYAVFPTMSVDGATVALGTYGIFDNKSQDVISDSLGYIGSNSRFNSIVTPFGYFVVDVINKEVYKITGVTAEPLSLGVKGYFEKHFRSDLKNPYLEGDYILGFNDKDKMVLLTCNDRISDNSFTMSYPIFNDSFFSFHSYIPSIYARTTSHLYSLINYGNSIKGGIYRHNNKSLKCIYYRYVTLSTNIRTQEEDIIDMLFNAGDNSFTNKLLEYVKWVTDTKIIDEDGNVRTLQDLTVDEIVVYSDTQCTQTKTVNKDDIDWYEKDSGANIQNNWAFNNILDSVDNPNDIIIKKDFELNINNIISKDYYDMSNFIGIFVIVRLIHKNNPVITDGKTEYVKQYINLIDVKFTKDER